MFSMRSIRNTTNEHQSFTGYIPGFPSSMNSISYIVYSISNLLSIIRNNTILYHGRMYGMSNTDSRPINCFCQPVVTSACNGNTGLN